MSIRERGIPLFETILGEYFFGLLHASTIHQRFSVSGSQPSLGKDDLEQRVTSLHEMLHALQDMLTGFGAFVSSHLDDLVSATRVTTGYLAAKHGSVAIPLSRWSEALPEEDRAAVDKMSSSYAALLKNLAMVQREGPTGVGAREILEGTAAFFSEVAERYSRWTYFYREPADARQGYDFDDVCQAVARLQPPYTAFVREYDQWTRELPPGTSSRQKSNFLFLLHDISLDVPPPEIITSRLASGRNEPEDFIPGYRYRSVMELVLAERLPLPDISSPPIVAPMTAMSRSDQTFLHSADEVPWRRLEIANEEFGGTTKDRSSDECQRFLDRIYEVLRWPRRDETVMGWLARMPKRHPLSSFQLFRTWRTACLKTRLEQPSPFTDFASILNRIMVFPFPLLYLTPVQARFWATVVSPDDFEEVQAFPRHVAFNMFSTTLAPQVMSEERLSCPFAGSPWTKEIKCPETKACGEGIELGDPKYDRCLFGNYFHRNFGIPPSKARYAT